MTIMLTKSGKFRTREWIKPLKDAEGRYVGDGHHSYYDLESADGVLSRWEEDIVLEDGVTLGSLFTAIRDISEYEKLGMMFENSWMREFIEEAFTPTDIDPDMLEIVWSWHAEVETGWLDTNKTFINNDLAPTKVNNSFTCYGNMNGVSKETDNWAIDGCPQNIYFDVPLRLDDTFKVWNGNTYSDTPLLESVKSWKFGEFLRTYFWEISFHGGPAQRGEFWDSMVNQLTEAHKNPSTLISAEEFT